jgi:hypothetical protein
MDILVQFLKNGPILTSILTGEILMRLRPLLAFTLSLLVSSQLPLSARGLRLPTLEKTVERAYPAVRQVLKQSQATFRELILKRRTMDWEREHMETSRVRAAQVSFQFITKTNAYRAVPGDLVAACLQALPGDSASPEVSAAMKAAAEKVSQAQIVGEKLFAQKDLLGPAFEALYSGGYQDLPEMHEAIVNMLRLGDLAKEELAHWQDGMDLILEALTLYHGEQNP